MTTSLSPPQQRPTRLHVVVAGASGASGTAVAVAVGLLAGWRYAAAAGWTVAAAVFVGWTWSVIGGLGADATAAHATRDDPARRLTDVVVLVASLASIGGVVYLLAAGSSGGGAGEALAAVLGIASVVGAWVVVHTVFTVRYASMYYTGEPGGIDFPGTAHPAYGDFAYVAFTLGMTYQVSDTDLQSSAIRVTALRHSLLSFVLGAVVLATVINLVAGLGSSAG